MPRRARPFPFLLAALVAASCALGACQGDAMRDPWKPGGGPLFNHPFAPESLRIHPLTHIDVATRNTASGPSKISVLVLHLELRDHWLDTSKGTGRLSVMLYKPGAGMQPGLETQELSWTVPGFEEPNANMRHWDAATRTYRIQLEAPAWVAATVADARSETNPGWLTVRAILSFGEGEQEKYLSDEFVLQR